MNIRRFRQGDLTQVLELCREVREYHREFLGGYFTKQDDEMEQVGFLESLENDKMWAFIAEENCVITGYILAEKKLSPYLEKSNVVHIINFGVKKDIRGKGIGKKLMDFLYELCQNENIDEIRLGVFNKNINAYKFYEKYGFKPFEQRMNLMINKED